MGLVLGIYSDPKLASEAEGVADGLCKLFPRLTVMLLGERAVPAAAWDTFLAQYDAFGILGLMAEPQESAAVLWLVEGDLGDSRHRGLFGAAQGRRAVVSAARLPDAGALVKEAGHEVGHMLGLGHCSGACLMRPAKTAGEVQSKAGAFCPACSEEINRATGEQG
ncbi:MAG TPA: hypothetical protein PKA10_07350 [Selenomonadales bacterium]|nr:hypothetical protein [Selenomonadales bacterium]